MQIIENPRHGFKVILPLTLVVLASTIVVPVVQERVKPRPNHCQAAYRRYKEACDYAQTCRMRPPAETLSCEEAKRRVNQQLSCAALRRGFAEQCRENSDAGHEVAISLRVDAALACTTTVAAKCGSEEGAAFRDKVLKTKRNLK